MKYVFLSLSPTPPPAQACFILNCDSLRLSLLPCDPQCGWLTHFLHLSALALAFLACFHMHSVVPHVPTYFFCQRILDLDFHMPPSALQKRLVFLSTIVLFLSTYDVIYHFFLPCFTLFFLFLSQDRCRVAKPQSGKGVFMIITVFQN